MSDEGRAYVDPAEEPDAMSYMDEMNEVAAEAEVGGTSELVRYADKAMFEAAPIEREEGKRVQPVVRLLSMTADPLGAIAAACRMYEGKPTTKLSDVTDDERRHYWEEVKKTHLKAPYEFVDLHFYIEGVDRAFTHQHVRQRTAVFAQESMRFAVKENMASEAAVPPSLLKAENRTELDLWDSTLDTIEDAYNALVGAGIPAEDARGILPHATTTRIHYKTNLRNLLDHAGNRLCTQAQWIWRYVFNGIVRGIGAYDPVAAIFPGGTAGTDHLWQFRLMADDDLFRPVCFSLGHCPFTADFDRGCTIRDRVQRGEFDAIQTAEWALDPEAGFVR